MKIKRIFVCLSFLFLITGYQKAANISTRALAEEVLKYRLHGQLEKTMGLDVNVENYFQALDHLAHGETDKAKEVFTEQVYFESLGFVMGSTGASLIGAAWEFDKWVWNSCQKWSDNLDKQKFIKDYLTPKIKQWKKNGEIPDWRLVMGDPSDPKGSYGSIEQWFDDHYHELKVTKLFFSRDEEIRKLKKEMWEHTRWIMGKMNQQFKKEKEVREKAEKAIMEHKQEVEKLALQAETIENSLLSAGVKPDKEMIKKCLLDPKHLKNLLDDAANRKKPEPTKKPLEKDLTASEEKDYSNLISGEWTVLRKNLYWKWDWEEDYWVIKGGMSNLSIYDVDKSDVCSGKLSGSIFKGKWNSSVGEFETVLRFSADGKKFEGETLFRYHTGGEGKELLKGSR